MTNVYLLQVNYSKINYCQQSLLGNHTFAIISGHENYDFLKQGLSPVLNEINTLIEKNAVNVNGEISDLNFVHGADYKVLTIRH